MSLKATLAQWYGGEYYGVGSNTEPVYQAMEGIPPSYRGLSQSSVTNLTVTTAQKVLATYRLPSPYGGVLVAGTYEIAFPVWCTHASVAATLIAKIWVGSTQFYSSWTNTGTDESEQLRTFEITVGSDTPVGGQAFYFQVNAESGTSSTVQYRLVDDRTYCGVKSTSATGAPRTPYQCVGYSPNPGTHASPTIVSSTQPAFWVDIRYIYPSDSIYLGHLTDTARTEAHSVGETTTWQYEQVDSWTDKTYVGPNTLRINVTAASDQITVPLNNTYYRFFYLDTSYHILAVWEILLNVSRPSLVGLNGAAAVTYVETDDVAPTVRWTDSNADTTHWQVRIYDTDDTLVKDSGETAVGTTEYQIPSVDISSATTYYTVVTLMRGSGGSTWTVDSERGYWQRTTTNTGVKITSHEGTLDQPVLETDTTPTIEWAFARTQQAYNVSIVDESDQSVDYTSGWTASATKSHTVGSALTGGKTYSIQVQVRDTIQAHAYAADKRAYIHLQDASVAAPSLTAEADTDHLTAITLAWTAPTVTDGDALTYEVSITGATSGATRAFNASAATSINLGYLPIDTYTWKVRATDEHGMVGEWSSTDEFAVADGGVIPVVTLIPCPSNVAPCVTTWTYFDQDGDAQSKYQVQLASDETFDTIIENSGEVSSTALYYQHTTTTAGTYYRRARVYAGASWSAYDDDTITIVGPTTQTDDLAVYLDAEGTPTALDQTAYPVSGAKVTFKTNAPAEATFTVNNFDALEGGIDDDEELFIYLKDSAGKRITFRGGVVDKDVGDMLTVTCRDIGRLFDRWRVTKTLSYLSLGNLIKSIVEDPTGHTATGITAHCEEIPTDTGVVTIASFVGAAKTLSAWLADFASATGYVWKLTYQDSGWHFWWFDPATQPVYAVTLKDNIDRAANSASQWRVGDEVRVSKDRSQYANRVVFSGIPDPPAVPGNGADFDQIFSEATTGWTAIGDATVSAGSTYKMRGAKSISLSLAEAHPYRDTIPLAYVRVPAELQDMTQGKSYGYLRADIRMTIGESAPAYSSFTGLKPDADIATYMEYIKPNLRPLLYVFTSEGAIAAAADIAPTTRWATDLASTCIDSTPNPAWSGPYDAAAFRAPGSFVAWTWMLPGLGAMGPGDIDMSAYKHVVALGFGLNLDRVYSTSEVFCNWFYSDTRDLVIHFEVDNIRIDPYEVGTTPIEMYVETAAVTAGTETPIEVPLGVTNLNVSSARVLSDLMLTTRNRTRLTVGSVTLDGMRNVPLGAQVPLALPNHGIASATKSLYEVNYLPLDSGDRTELGLGDPEQDVDRTLMTVRQKLDALVGGTL